MDTSSLLQEIQLLEISLGIIKNKDRFDKLSVAEVSLVTQGYIVFQNYYPSEKIPSGISDPASFFHFLQSSGSTRLEIENKIKELKQENGVPSEEPIQDLSVVNGDNELKVALYKEHQASVLDSDEVRHPVSDTIKRARKTWFEHEKIRLIRENTNKSDSSENDQKFSQTIDSKATSRKEIEESLYTVASLSVSSQIKLFKIPQNQADTNAAISKIVTLIESGSIDINNLNDLNIVTQLALKDVYQKESDFDEIDTLVTKKLIDSEEDDSVDQNIEDAEQKIKNNLYKSTEKFKDEIINQNKDFDIPFLEATKKTRLILTKLGEAYPNAKIPFSNLNIRNRQVQEFEKLIDKYSPGLLSNQTTAGAARLAGTLSVTGGNINPNMVKLIGRGLDENKLNKFIQEHGNKPEVAKASRSTDYFFKQIKKVIKSKHKTDITEGPRSMVGNYINRKVGEQAGKTILKYTSNATAKRLGNFLLEHGLKEGAQKFASAAAQKLLVAGAKQAGVGAAKAAGMAAADGVISAAALALGIPTAGLSLIIAAVLVTIQIGWEIAKYGFTQLRRQFLSDEEWKKNKKAAWMGLGALALTGFAIKRGARGFAVATQAAVISAVGIIILSLTTIAVFLTLTFLTAPLLSTFVQFDSMEKVKYGALSSSDDTASCGTNADRKCQGSYCFPVNDTKTVSYITYHHDYAAVDIMRIGDKPGAEDDKPLPILAYTSGYVLNAYDDPKGGVSIFMVGDDGRYYYYTHNASNIVKSGDRIEMGDIIACMGSSGNAESHAEMLHFQISKTPDMNTSTPENYPNFIWPYEDFCKNLRICGGLNEGQYPE